MGPYETRDEEGRGQKDVRWGPPPSILLRRQGPDGRDVSDSTQLCHYSRNTHCPPQTSLRPVPTQGHRTPQTRRDTGEGRVHDGAKRRTK